jgi:inward rectifier potassium channel
MATHHSRDPGSKIIKTTLGFDFAKIGATRFDLADPYHMALTVRWPAFVLGVLVCYGVITAAFAGLYLARSGCIAHARPGSIADAFFFSIETLATVGYGEMTPGSLYGHLVSSAEIVTGMAFTAIMTGLIFVRFSKAKAKLVYADVAVITRHNGRPTLMLQLGNARTSLLTRVKVSLNVLLQDAAGEDETLRHLHELPLDSATVPIFPLILRLMHDIDEHSPFAGLAASAITARDMRLVLSIEARDPQLSSLVYDIKMYDPTDIRLGVHFVNAVSRHPKGHMVADLTRIGQTEPDDVP